MITLYSGTPGAGKSLHLAEVLYYRVKNYKGVVIGNFDLNTGNIKGKHKGKYISIGPVTTKTAQENGLSIAKTAVVYTARGMVETMIQDAVEEGQK